MNGFSGRTVVSLVRGCSWSNFGDLTIRRNRKRCSTLTRVFSVVTFVTFEFSSWFRGHWSSSYLTDRSRSTVPFIQLHGAAYENLRYVWSHLARSSCAERYRDLIHHFSRAGGSKDREIYAVSAARKIALRFENLRFHSRYLSRIATHAVRVRVYKVSKYSCLHLVDAYETSLFRNLYCPVASSTTGKREKSATGHACSKLKRFIIKISNTRLRRVRSLCSKLEISFLNVEA